jgi:hypothetical protein
MEKYVQDGKNMAEKDRAEHSRVSITEAQETPADLQGRSKSSSTSSRAYSPRMKSFILP